MATGWLVRAYLLEYRRNPIRIAKPARQAACALTTQASGGSWAYLPLLCKKKRERRKGISNQFSFPLFVLLFYLGGIEFCPGI